MTRLVHALALFTLLLLVAARDTSPRSLHARHLEAAERWRSVARGRSIGSAGNTRRDSGSGPVTRSVKNITFTNPEASGVYTRACVSRLLSDAILAFYVDGTSIPLVNFDVGPSWSGLIPISSSSNETRKVWLYGTSTN